MADLESVDAVEEEVRPLRNLVAELGRVAAVAGLDRSELERVWERAPGVLRAFAAPDGREGSQGGEVSGRDPGFWKR